MRREKMFTYMICALLAMCISSCDKGDAPKTGFTVTTSVPQQDAVNDITLWIFNVQGVLSKQYVYASQKEMTDASLEIPAGKYTLVGATNLQGSFTHNATEGTTHLEELLLFITDASASPLHAHYGVMEIDVKADVITPCNLSLNRVMAELSFAIANVPTEVVSAGLKVYNSSKGFYPATRKLHPEAVIVDFGQAAIKDNKVSFPLKRLMPIVARAVRADGEAKTQLQLIFKYSNGNSLIFDVETPTLQNGGTYTPQIEYDILRPDMVIKVDAINGWEELPPIDGEILNTNNKQLKNNQEE